MTTLPQPHRVSFVVALLILAGSIFWHVQHNDFPAFYHPDEYQKGVQVVTGTLNFHHPLLLLDGAGILLWMSGLPATADNAVVCGRWASAVYASLSLCVLGLFAWRRAGPIAALATVFLVALHPLFYELAHYCKEDPALLLGLCLGMLALDLFLEAPHSRRAAFLGLACGVAVSGKYIGIVMFLAALPWVIMRGKSAGTLGKLSMFFIFSFLLTVLAINFPFLKSPDQLGTNIAYELQAAQAGGAKGLTKDVPHLKYVNAFQENVGWPLWLGLAIYAIGGFLRKAERRASDWMVLALPLGYAVLLSFSPKTSNRYFLAVSPFLILCASIGMVWLAEWAGKFSKQARILVLLTTLGSALVVQWQLSAPTVRSFQHDSRKELAVWIANQLPAGCVVLAETRVSLGKPEVWPNTTPRQDIHLHEVDFLPDAGTFDALSAQGVTHVAAIRTNYGGYLSKKRKPSPNQAELHRKRAEFYQKMLDSGDALAQFGGTGVHHLNPEVVLYAIPANPHSPASKPPLNSQTPDGQAPQP